MEGYPFLHPGTTAPGPAVGSSHGAKLSPWLPHKETKQSTPGCQVPVGHF